MCCDYTHPRRYWRPAACVVITYTIDETGVQRLIWIHGLWRGMDYCGKSTSMDHGNIVGATRIGRRTSPCGVILMKPVHRRFCAVCVVRATVCGVPRVVGATWGLARRRHRRLHFLLLLLLFLHLLLSSVAILHLPLLLLLLLHLLHRGWDRARTTPTHLTAPHPKTSTEKKIYPDKKP